MPAEDLIAGPMGYRVQVVDYDSTTRRFHGAHELPATPRGRTAGMGGATRSIVDDFRFHAQNVYALVMKTLARFEFALGRRLGWSFRTHQLKVAPHGMFDANAFYSPARKGWSSATSPAVAASRSTRASRTTSSCTRRRTR